jgi:hypothetical protein
MNPDLPRGQRERSGPSDPTARAKMFKPLNVNLDRPTMCDALNAIALAHGEAAWVFEPKASDGRPRVYLEGFSWAVSASARR